jgi:hypothetical protein
MVKTESIVIVSLHPDREKPLPVDLKDILTALGPQLSSWIWCVRNLDWLGEQVDAICKTAEAARPGGIWMDSGDLLKRARCVYQTIEGEFLAFPRDVDPNTVPARELDLRAFPASRAELGIVAVDGVFFEVYAKDTEMIAGLRAIGDVRDESPDNYF